MLRRILLSLLLTHLLFAYGICETNVNRCSTGSPKSHFVDISGCVNPPCLLKLGTTVVAYINFTSVENTDSLKINAQAKVAFIPFPVDYPLPQPDGCKALTNTHCPLEKSEPGQYKLEMPLDERFPTVDLTLKLYLEGNGIKGNEVTCFEVACKVVK